MTYDDLIIEARNLMGKHLDQRRGRRSRLLDRAELDRYVDFHIRMAQDIAAEAGKTLEIVRLTREDCLGFVEVCAADASVNGLLFIQQIGGRYRTYAFGVFAGQVDWDAFNASIVEVWEGIEPRPETENPR